ncbi:MAG: heme-binding protein, partial [Desulfotignum sp.]
MKHFLLITTVTALLVTGAINAMAIEEAEYTVIKKDTHFEIRDYAPHIIAETVVQGNLKDAGDIAFKKLFGYISGDNRSRDKVSMTAPVSQKPEGEKIEMTAPVAQQRDKESWVVSFMMPSTYTIKTLPEPEDNEITLRQV